MCLQIMQTLNALFVIQAVKEKPEVSNCGH